MIDPSLYRNTDAWTLENHTKYINHTYLMHFWPNPGLQTVVSLILKCYNLKLTFYTTGLAKIWVKMPQFLSPKPDQKRFSGPTLVYWPCFNLRFSHFQISFPFLDSLRIELTKELFLDLRRCGTQLYLHTSIFYSKVEWWWKSRIKKSNLVSKVFYQILA